MSIFRQLQAEKRGSLENPSTPLGAPDAWLSDALTTGTATKTGKAVNEFNALGNTALAACVGILSETIATLPLHIFRRTGRNRELADDLPLAQVLRQPNPEMDAVQFRETLQSHVLTWGNGYAEIEFNRAGRPIALWILPPDRTKAYRDKRLGLYYVTEIDRKSYVLPPENVFHLVGLGYDGITGRSPIRLHREAIGLSRATEDFGASWFGNGSRPAGILSHPGTLGADAKQNLRKSWDAAHSGLSNAHRVAILEEGMRWDQIGIPPEDAQFLETRKFQIEEMARIYRVPLHLIQHAHGATSWGSGLEELGQGLVTYTLQPWLVRWEQRIASRLMTEAERGQYYAKHSVEGLLRGDSEKRANFYSRMIQTGVYTLNEVRELEDRNPIDGGDVHLVPLNLIPLSQVESSAAAAMPEPRAISETRAAQESVEQRSVRLRRRNRQAFESLFAEAARRTNVWDLARLKAAVERAKKAGNLQLLRNWLEAEREATVAYARRQFEPVVQSYARTLWDQVAEEVGKEEPVTDDYQRFQTSYAIGLGNRFANQAEVLVSDQAERFAEEADIIEAIEERLEDFAETRQNSFSSDELVQATGALAKAAYIGLGVTLLRWVANAGACPMCEGMNGRVVGVERNFADAGSSIDFGGTAPLVVSRNIGHPPLHRGCTCDIVAG
jgi:HK97 family phage portal protein